MMNANVVKIKRHAPITGEERQGIARAYRGGKTIEEIMTMFSVSETSVKRILDENKIPYPKKRQMWTDDEKKKVERYCNLGWDAETIAKQLGRNKSSVVVFINKNISTKLNQQERRLKSWTTSEAQKCKELFEQGIRVVDIARELGRTEGSVSGWISDNLRNTLHSRRIATRRLDGTPMPVKKEETPVKPSLAEQIENAKNKMADDAGLTVEENHTKIIRGKMGVYTLRMDKNLMDFSLNAGVFTKEEFGALADEMAKVYALM